MKLYVLDTETLTLVQEGHSTVSRRFLQKPAESLAITVLTVEEPPLRLVHASAQSEKTRAPGMGVSAVGRKRRLHVTAPHP